MQPSMRPVGIVALVAAVWLVLGNVTHPIGSTDLYTDGVAFVEHTGTYWVVNHVLLAVALLVTPWLAWAWRERLTSDAGRMWGTFGVILVVMGSVFSVFHLGGIDGVALPAYAEVLETADAGAAVGAEALMKVHLASITAWSVILWGGAQLTVGVTEVLEGRRPGLGWLLVVCGLLGFAFAVAVTLEGHLTGFSDGVLLRGATVGFTVWFIWTAWELYHSPTAVHTVGA